jgi:alpha,alpha-trehalase
MNKIKNLTNRILFFLFILSPLLLSVVHAKQTVSPSETHDSNSILLYIADAWKALMRSMNDCQSLVDPKTQVTSILYLPYDLPKKAMSFNSVPFT